MRIRAVLFSLLVAFTAPALAQNSALAQNIVGFPREDFGKVVLSQKQLGAGGKQFEINIGNYNNEPISKYGANSFFAKLGRPVGRLDILTDAGIFPCTAFLISAKYIITNYHCVPGVTDQIPRATRIEAVQLVLGYIQEGVEDNVGRFNVSSVPVEGDKELDYAILEVFGNPSRSFGTIKLASAKPENNVPFWIIGHPMGEAQRVSREGCSSATPALAGGKLRHRCDTLPGNSGSPVFDIARQAVVAIHHAGSKRNSINYAIPFSRIVKRSRILAGLMAPGAANRIPKFSNTQPTVNPPDSKGAADEDNFIRPNQSFNLAVGQSVELGADRALLAVKRAYAPNGGTVTVNLEGQKKSLGIGKIQKLRGGDCTIAVLKVTSNDARFRFRCSSSGRQSTQERGDVEAKGGFVLAGKAFVLATGQTIEMGRDRTLLAVQRAYAPNGGTVGILLNGIRRSLDTGQRISFKTASNLRCTVSVLKVTWKDARFRFRCR